MSRRKPPPVTLAAIAGDSTPKYPPVERKPSKPEPNVQRAGATVAERAIAGFKAMGYRAGQAPTPERLLRAGGAAHVNRFVELVEVSKADKFEHVQADMMRVVIADDPFSMICRKKLLAPGDAAANLALASAGLRYRQAWRGAGLEAVRSIDFERVGVSSNACLFATEAAAQAFALFRKIKESIPPDYRKAVDAVVLEDRDLVDVGREVSPYKAPKQAAAVAMTDLRRGLKCAAAMLGLWTETMTAHAESADAGAGKNPESS